MSKNWSPSKTAKLENLYYSGFTFEEIAKRLGKPIPNIISKLRFSDIIKEKVTKRLKYTRLATYSLEEILPYITAKEKTKIKLGEYSPNCCSLRLQTFKRDIEKGLDYCPKCGIKVSFFALEYQFKCNPHLNLYGLNNEGEEILMTRDHIIPLSKGGPDTLDNLQIMCYDCNIEKGANIEEN